MQKWFDFNNPSLPQNLLFEDEKGSLSLYGIRTHHASIGSGPSLGRFAPDAVVFARAEGDLKEPLMVEALRSKLDGLADWVDTQAISVETQSDAEGRLTGIDVSVRSPEDIEWTQGDAHMSLAVHWNWSGGRELKIEEYVLLQSSFHGRKGLPDEHLDQHRVIRT
ncbi:ApeA N-terminal domain 1-containing protein, partial [Corynebacterium dentalis]|uniref:ApeA N-terminal domain 1-containing protein n=1 Tax=Corynebacterium dentalis TaxID=2014528 RepID=UPI0028980662